MSEYVCTKERFLEDVKDHKMEIKKDDGLYRHIVFSKGSFDQKFELITWPGSLVVSGDMGAYHFSRMEDMFCFFGGKDSKKELSINPGYWSEKLQNKNGYEEFSSEKLVKCISQRVNNFLADNDIAEEDFSEFSEKIEEIKEARSFEEAYSLMFSIDKYTIFDDFDLNALDYTFSYIWCCYAIVFGINKYKELNHDN